MPDKRLLMRLTLSMGVATACAGLQTAAQAQPNWETITKSDQGVFAIDNASVTREGSVRKFTTVLDYRQPQSMADGKSYQSTLSHVQLDCGKRQARIVNLSYLSGKMGAGSVVHRETIIREWMPVVPTSPIEGLAKRVC